MSGKRTGRPPGQKVEVVCAKCQTNRMEIHPSKYEGSISKRFFCSKCLERYGLAALRAEGRKDRRDRKPSEIVRCANPDCPRPEGLFERKYGGGSVHCSVRCSALARGARQRSSNKVERECAHAPCGEIFAVKDAHQLYCCREHAMAARRNLEERICPNCGDVFRPRTQGQKHCSGDCYHEAMKKPQQRTCIYTAGGVHAFMARPSEKKQACGMFHAELARIKHPLDREHNGKPAKLNVEGYVLIWEPEHPRSHQGWLREHIWVKEQELGESIPVEIEVHHVNRNRQDNRPENLEMEDGLSHARITATDVHRRARDWDRMAVELAQLKAENARLRGKA